MTKNDFVAHVLQEFARATCKFPDPYGTVLALTEEVGELAKALADEPAKNVWAEAVQVAAMAMRIAVEGDPSINIIRKARGMESYPPAS